MSAVRINPVPNPHWHHRYSTGAPYYLARGRHAPRQRVEDRGPPHPWVTWLPKDKPAAADFLLRINREMRIRFYQPKTIRAYRRALAGFLRWLNAAPHEATREDIREYLEFLVDGGASSSWVGVHLAAFRTTFDKMCGGDLTLGLQTPRHPKKLPIVLSQEEIVRLLKAAPSLRDKMLLGLMYATGVRVSEIVRLRWRDIDFERRSVRIWQGKGRTDRDVLLPESFRPLLLELAKAASPESFLFPAHDPRRYISPRTVQRVVQRALAIAGIAKQVTPHGLRHCCATHMLEHGTDIRFIQKLLGHVRLETTTLYTRVASLPKQQARSPLDVLVQPPASIQPISPGAINLLEHGHPPRTPKLQLRFELRLLEHTTTTTRSAEAVVHITNADAPVKLEGLRLIEVRPGWVSLEVPPCEKWDEPLRWLDPAQRERLGEPEFFRLLQEELTRRFLRLAA